jgi:hypothetical protein
MNKKIGISLIVLAIVITIIGSFHFPSNKDGYPKERERIYPSAISDTETVMETVLHAENSHALDGEVGSEEVLKTLTDFKDWGSLSDDKKITMKIPSEVLLPTGKETPMISAHLALSTLFPETYHLGPVTNNDPRCVPGLCIEAPFYTIKLLPAESIADLQDKVAEILSFTYASLFAENDPCGELLELRIGRKLENEFYTIIPIVSDKCQSPGALPRIKFDPVHKEAVIMMQLIGIGASNGEIVGGVKYAFPGGATSAVSFDRLIFESISLQ